MPYLADPSRPVGTLRTFEQPFLDVDERLALRPWRESDAEAVKAAFDHPDIQRWHLRRMATTDEARTWVAGWATRWHNETDGSWAIVGRHDDQPIGQVGLRTVSLFEGSAQLSYWVVPDARGAGVAARAALTLTQWVFDTVGLHRVFLQHSTANPASCRIAAKLGFTLEGTLRGALLHADGWHDMHSHARLRTDGDGTAPLA